MLGATHSAMSAALETLLRHPAIWRGAALAPETAALPSGFPELDAELPGGGWPRGALTEIQPAAEGIGELRLALPALVALTREGAWAALIAPPHQPYAPAFAAAGVVLSRLLVVRATGARDRLWAAEQALRAPVCGVVLAWLPGIAESEVRRLQLAAREGGGCGVLYREAGSAAHSTWAALRLSLQPTAAGLEVRILKRRGGVASGVVRVAAAWAGFS